MPTVVVELESDDDDDGDYQHGDEYSRCVLEFVCSHRWGSGVVICLERGADLHMVQLMPLPLCLLLQ